ncbi:MAG: SOS response-associated peptidase [Kiritimatiellae bacterium]|nr:SOS response-associated peptidase [Kiritimatiellia bacterium]
MCGRYTLTVSKADLSARFLCDLTGETGSLPRFNIAPTQEAPVVIRDGTRGRVAYWMRWGLPSPVWAPDDHRGWINARAESAAQKPAFRDLVNSRRCLVPADGFYEWRRHDARSAQPYRFARPDRALFAFAGLWMPCRAEDAPSLACERGAFAILTTAASETVAPIHDRMPVILPPDQEAVWLDESVPYDRLPEGWMNPARTGPLEVYPVSRAVNNVAHDAEDCIRPHAPPADLFGHG